MDELGQDNAAAYTSNNGCGNMRETACEDERYLQITSYPRK